MHLVLLGLPGAGKSALLGDLVLAAHRQQALLDGRFVSVPDELKQLCQRVYADAAAPRGTPPLGLTRSHAMRWRSRPTAPGRVPGDHLRQLRRRRRRPAPARKAARREEQADTLAGAVREADGLILVLDASATPEDRERQFAVFGEFLHRMEEVRGRRTEISGLPVFLVLTKCDLLAGRTIR